MTITTPGISGEGLVMIVLRSGGMVGAARRSGSLCLGFFLFSTLQSQGVRMCRTHTRLMRLLVSVHDPGI